MDELVAEGKTFDIRADTPVDEIIQYFNSKGVYYEEPWLMHRRALHELSAIERRTERAESERFCDCDTSHDSRKLS